MSNTDLGVAHGLVDIDTTSLSRAASSFLYFGKILVGVGGLMVGAFALAVNESAKFEAELSKFKAVTGATDEQVAQLKTQLLEMGNTSVFSAGQIAEAAVALGKAGLTTEEVLGGAAKAAISLAAAAEGINLDQAAEIMANAMRTFGLEASDATHIADVMAGAANRSTIEVDDLATSLKYAGPVAHGLGISLDDLATSIAILGDRGIKGSTAGTSLRTMLLSLTPSSKEAQKEMEKLGLITADGTNLFYDQTGSLKPLSEVYQILQDSMAGMTDQQRIHSLETIFQKRAMASVEVLLQSGSKGFDEYAASIAKTSAADVAAEKLDNLSGDMQKLKNHFKSFLIEAGGPFQETSRQLVQNLDKLLTKFQELSPETQKMIMQFLLWGGIALITLGMLSIFIGTMAKIAVAAKTLGSAISALRIVFVALNGVSLSGIIGAFQALWAVVIANPVVAIIVAIIALVALGYLLYVKWQPFHDLVDQLWDDFQRGLEVLAEWGNTAGDKIDTVETSLQDLWAQFQTGLENVTNWKDNTIKFFEDVYNGVKNWLGQAVDFVANAWNTAFDFITTLPEKIGGMVDGIEEPVTGAVSSMTDTVTKFFSELPATLGGWIQTAVDAVVDFFSQLPYRVGFVLGFLLGSIIKFGIDTVTNLYNTGTEVIAAVVGWFQSLPETIGGWLTTAWETITGWATQVRDYAIEIGSQWLNNIITFFQQLPARIGEWLMNTWINIQLWASQMWTYAQEIGSQWLENIIGFFASLPSRIVEWLTNAWANIQIWAGQMWAYATEIGSQWLDNIIDFVQKLPERVVGFLQTTIGGIIGATTGIAGAAVALGAAFLDPIVGTIQSIPQTIENIFNGVISFISGMVTSAWNIASDFAQGLWDGFKSGLGIASPSYIEDAMTAIEGKMKSGTKVVANQMDILRSMGNPFSEVSGAMTLTAATVPLALNSGVQSAPAELAAAAAQSGGDHIAIYGTETKTAMEISREIITRKKVKSRG